MQAPPASPNLLWRDQDRKDADGGGQSRSRFVITYIPDRWVSGDDSPDFVQNRRRQARVPAPPRPPRDNILFPVEVWKLVLEYLYTLGQSNFVGAVRFLSALRSGLQSDMQEHTTLLGHAQDRPFLPSWGLKSSAVFLLV